MVGAAMTPPTATRGQLGTRRPVVWGGGGTSKIKRKGEGG